MPVIRLENGVELEVLVEGEGIPCLITGPGSIYLPTIPDGIKESIQFISVDYYWTNRASIDSDIIQSLTMNEIVRDLENIRRALDIPRVLLFGPSAVGLVAMEYARCYPENTLGVIALGTPLSMERLPDRGRVFFEGNYNPTGFRSPDFNESSSKWQFFVTEQEHRQRRVEEGFSTLTEDYLSELYSDQPRYYHNPENALSMYERWRSFNIEMRQKFFQEIFRYDSSILREVTCPVFIALGLHDGIVPAYSVPDEIKNSAYPDNFEYYIFESSAHMPQIEEKECFIQQVLKWLNNVQAQDEDAFYTANRISI